MKLSEVVRKVIGLAEASRAYWDRELRKHHPHYPIIGSSEDSGPPPPEDAEMAALLKNLPEDQLYYLVTLAFVGRGDFSADHLAHAYQVMKDALPSKELAIAQITSTNTLAEYLTDATEEIERRHIDLDSLTLANIAGMS